MASVQAQAASWGTPAGVEERGRRRAAAAWLTLTAPGALLAEAMLVLALVVVPLLTPFFFVPATVRAAAVLLLALHLGSVALAVQRPGNGAASVFFALLAIDALLCGLLASGGESLWRLGVPILIFVLAIGVMTGGPWTIVLAASSSGLGAGIGAWLRATGRLVFETSAAAPAQGIAAMNWPSHTALSVETTFAGVAVAAPGVDVLPAAPLFIPAVTIALLALAVGNAASLARVRRTQSAIAATIKSTARLPW